MRSDFEPSVQIYKMQGSGNDFILLDNREYQVPRSRMSDWAGRICHRALGAGSDGLIFLDSAPADSKNDYIWHFYNSDGSRAEMCGNGSRCAARLAYELRIAGLDQVLGTDAGPVRAQVLPKTNEARVQLTRPQGLQTDLRLRAADRQVTAHYVDTGVPHLVCPVQDVQAVDLPGLAPPLRYHREFAPQGTNVDFIQVVSPDRILLRTYERGVEAETLACGTGAAAALYVAHQLGLAGLQAQVVTSGKETLKISLEGNQVFLQGPALLVYQGRLFLASIGLGPD